MIQQTRPGNRKPCAASLAGQTLQWSSCLVLQLGAGDRFEVVYDRLCVGRVCNPFNSWVSYARYHWVQFYRSCSINWGVLQKNDANGELTNWPPGRLARLEVQCNSRIVCQKGVKIPLSESWQSFTLQRAQKGLQDLNRLPTELPT